MRKIGKRKSLTISLWYKWAKNWLNINSVGGEGEKNGVHGNQGRKAAASSASVAVSGGNVSN